MVFTYSLQI